MLSMAAGENLDTDDYFGLHLNETEHHNTAHLHYEVLSTASWIVVVILMTVLSNLWVTIEHNQLIMHVL